MLIRTLFFVFIFGCRVCLAQQADAVMPTIPAYDAGDRQIFSLMTNPALVKGYKKPVIGVASDMLYSVKEMTVFRLAVVLPVNEAAFSGHLIHFGNVDFSTSSLALQYARKLSAQTDAGCVFGFRQQRYKGYFPVQTLSAGFGLRAQIATSWHGGLMLMALHRSETRRWDLLAYNMGLGYSWTPQFHVSMHLDKPNKEKSAIYFLMRYALRKKLEMSIMGTPENSSVGCRVVFQTAALTFGFSVMLHPALGMTPGIMVMTNTD
jgi:hypothetical protein